MPKVPSVPEATFLQCWKVIGGCVLVPEVEFHKTRKWRFDFAAIGARGAVAFEIEGLVRPGKKSRHTTNDGYRKDCEKYNAAAMRGWFVIRLTQSMIQPAYLEEIREAFGL